MGLTALSQMDERKFRFVNLSTQGGIFCAEALDGGLSQMLLPRSEEQLSPGSVLKVILRST